MWEIVGYIMASKYRQAIIKKLSRKNYLPSKIVDETGYHFSHISRALKQLKKKGLVVCLNKNSKKGRIYSLTEKGTELYQLMKDQL